MRVLLILIDNLRKWSRSYDLDENAAFLYKQVLKQALADLFKLVVYTMVIHEEEREVFLCILCVLFAVNHRVAEICVYLLRYHVNELTFLLLFAHVNQQLLRCLRLRQTELALLHLDLRFVRAEHGLKYSQVPLMLERYPCKQWVVVACILVQLVVAHEDHLHFFHVVLLVHLECASIDHLLQGWFRWTSVHLVIVEIVVHLIRKLVALFEALVVCAHKHNTQVGLFEADVYVEHILFCAAGHADWCPSLAICHRSQRHHEVEKDSNICNKSWKRLESTTINAFA